MPRSVCGEGEIICYDLRAKFGPEIELRTEAGYLVMKIHPISRKLEITDSVKILYGNSYRKVKNQYHLQFVNPESMVKIKIDSQINEANEHYLCQIIIYRKSWFGLKRKKHLEKQLWVPKQV